MATSQPLMALMSTDVRLVDSSASAANAPVTEDGGDFAQLLAAQLPEELQPAISQLTAEQLALLEQAALAADGKTLPPVEDWLQQLPVENNSGEPVAEDALGAIVQWLELLQAAPAVAADAEQLPANTNSPAAVTLVAPATPGAVTQPASSINATAVSADDTELSVDADSNDQSKRSPGDRELVSKDSSPTADSSRAQRTASAAAQDVMAAQQRVTAPGNNEPAAPATSAAMLGKLVEQLERAGTASARDEQESLEALARPMQQGSAAAALTARPVTAASQAMGVPFGQSGWSEATVEKVMWMSSQNLRSVEIRLDPAELGPMEIHIQNRGQELQVQFVSQNPAVREALEAQMHRLREMFGQQGLEQAQVTVADRSPGDQPGQRQHEEQLAQQGSRGQYGSTGAASSETDAETPAHSAMQRWSTPRLIDYYA